MSKIKKITIENFRGISKKQEFDFQSGRSSVVIYGRNGTGKSSIVDAWEWLYSSKIIHLSREGVGEKDFPNRYSNYENSYIQVELTNDNGVPIKAQFNKNKITDSIKTGDHSLIINTIPHPCHLRFKDLQEFVYYTKTAKYKYLAKYLGFESFLTLQEGTLTLLNKLQSKIQTESSSLDRISSRLVDCLGNEISPNAVINAINQLSSKHGITEITNIKQISTVNIALEKVINDNPNAKLLTQWQNSSSEISNILTPLDLKEDIESIGSLFEKIKSDENNIAKLFLKELYVSGLKILEKQEDKTNCPLCDNIFEGNLQYHILTKHNQLEALTKNKDLYENKVNSIKTKLILHKTKIQRFETNITNQVKEINPNLLVIIPKLKAGIDNIVEILNISITDLENLSIDSIKEVQGYINCLCEEAKKASDSIKVQVDFYQSDNNSNNLANDFKKITDIQGQYLSYLKAKKKIEFLEKFKENYDTLYDTFNLWVKSRIQESFDKISSDVICFFNQLESDSPHITNPKIVLNTDKLKAIELEIQYDSDKISPAYKVLSESQVNSFGLSIFLASIKNFNTQLKFIILDDVINSFDLHKRPKVIELINEHFRDFQFLVLTHDQIWFEQVKRTFKTWTKLHFSAWDSVNGPKVQLSKHKLDEIREHLTNDKPILAGQELGRYLEWILQEYNQNLQTPIRYKIDNQYTLAELFDPFKARVKSKLKADSPLYQELEQFDKNTIFRNFCAHFKNTESEFSTSEINTIVEHWNKIEGIMLCVECGNTVQYESSSGEIKCKCPKKNLTKPVIQTLPPSI